MRAKNRQSLVLAALAGAFGLYAPSAVASNPLEFPDNGSAAFSRGGAWLALANEPIATHYNPAALATQATAFSVEQQLNFTKTCYDRRGPNNSYVGPRSDTVTLANGQTVPSLMYEPVCNQRTSFPNAIPSLSLVWRVADRLGIGFAIVPPATYGTADGDWPVVTEGLNNRTGKPQMVPAPYRYMQLSQLTTIIYPTVGVGYELFDHFRLGAAFVAGMAMINTSVMGVTTVSPDPMSGDPAGDHMGDDSLSTLRTEDLFVPGVILSMHWSVLPQVDVGVWYRWMDAVKSDHGYFEAETNYFDNASGRVASKAGGALVPNRYDDALTQFEFPIPPELRVGARFHQPRAHSRLVFADGGQFRDPLHDDVFDVELDGSYTWNSAADTIKVRFKDNGMGAGAIATQPTNVPLPPNADKPLGYIDSVGIRLGGQWNVIQDRLGLRAGGWYESRSQDPAYLEIQPVGAARWGFGGGVVFRQNFIDISLGYQRHETAGLDNGGNTPDAKGNFPGLKAAAGTGFDTQGRPFSLNNEPANVSAEDRTQFRTIHSVNGGHVTFAAHVFTLGGTVRF